MIKGERRYRRSPASTHLAEAGPASKRCRTVTRDRSRFLVERYLTEGRRDMGISKLQVS